MVNPNSFLQFIIHLQCKKELVLFVLIGYLFVIVISNLILKKLYALKENILINQEFLSKRLVRGFMELVVFRTNKKFDSEISLTEEGIKNIVDGKTKIKLVHEIFFTAFALIGKAYEPIAIFNVEYVDYKLNKVAVNKYIDFLNAKDDSSLDSGKKIKSLTGKIEFKDVSFGYNENQLIKDLSLLGIKMSFNLSKNG